MPPEFDTRHNARAISRWSQPGFSRVPFRACTDAQLYFVCPDHQRTCRLKGELAGLLFKNGVKEGDHVNAGMSADFDIRDHGLTRLRVAELHGLVFATFSDATGPLQDDLGPQVMPAVSTESAKKKDGSLRFRSRLCV